MQRKERYGLRCSFAAPKILWDSNPTLPAVIRLWETFTFYEANERVIIKGCVQ